MIFHLCQKTNDVKSVVSWYSKALNGIYSLRIIIIAVLWKLLRSSFIFVCEQVEVRPGDILQPLALSGLLRQEIITVNDSVSLVYVDLMGHESLRSAGVNVMGRL